MTALEDLLAEYAWLYQRLSGGRFTRRPSTFAHRKFCRTTMAWRLLEAEELRPGDGDEGYGNYNTTLERVKIMRMQSNEDWPSSPHRPSRYVVRFKSPRGLAIHGFMKLHIARVFIDRVTQGYKTTWASSTLLRAAELELDISCPELEDIMESTADFDLPAPYPSYADGIRGTPSYYDTTPEAPAKRAKRAKSDRKAAPSAGSGTTLADLATELGIETRKARAILRKAGIGKPYQWEDTAPILKLLQAAT